MFFCMIFYASMIVFQNALLETLEEIDSENNIKVILEYKFKQMTYGNMYSGNSINSWVLFVIFCLAILTSFR